MISQTTEYALRAIVWLAENSTSAQTRQQIADATRVPADYLAKVMRSLGRAGLVQAGRGLHGGFTLSRPANRITVLEVVNVVDPIQRILICPLGLSAHAAQLCPLHRRLDNAMSAIEEGFRQTLISELIGQPGSARPLCNVIEPFVVVPA
ncbi:MAG: Rrf2 family transcriptional regulator [Bryobacteraceae bacterium]